MFLNAYQGKRVLVTGHTGFKGTWMCEWLSLLGAEMHGYALDPAPHAVLFDQVKLQQRMCSDTRADLADGVRLARIIADLEPDFIFHLAAQPLVRHSYRHPVDTFVTNVIGTIHVLEAVRAAKLRCVTICVTTDKCYENDGRVRGYEESDPMGGHDPYSASKGCAELAIASYRRSFFSNGMGAKLASARAGNVLGGGDWSEDRVIPDCIRALSRGGTVQIRNPQAIRPWQHVLEPLSGYLHLAARLATERDRAANEIQDEGLCSAFNFGPARSSCRSVAQVVEEVFRHWPGKLVVGRPAEDFHEAAKLELCTAKAARQLSWAPVWSFEKTIENTVTAYRYMLEGGRVDSILRSQIENYVAVARDLRMPWCG